MNRSTPAAATNNVGQAAVNALFGVPALSAPPRGRTDTCTAPEPEVEDAEVFLDPEGDPDDLAGGQDCKLLKTTRSARRV